MKLRKKLVTKELVDQWWKLHIENRMSIRAISQRTGYSEAAVSEHLKKRRDEAGIIRPKPTHTVNVTDLSGGLALERTGRFRRRLIK